MRNMVCTHCASKQASIYFRSEINGRVEERWLCGDCAAQMGFCPERETQMLLQGFWEGFALRPLLVAGPLCQAMNIRAASPAPVTVYPTARVQEEVALVDAGQQQALSLRRRRNALGYALKQAIAAQDFEQAAQLRDDLKKLESESGEKRNEVHES